LSQIKRLSPSRSEARQWLASRIFACAGIDLIEYLRLRTADSILLSHHEVARLQCRVANDLRRRPARRFCGDFCRYRCARSISGDPLRSLGPTLASRLRIRKFRSPRQGFDGQRRSATWEWKPPGQNPAGQDLEASLSRSPSHDSNAPIKPKSQSNLSNIVARLTAIRGCIGPISKLQSRRALDTGRHAVRESGHGTNRSLEVGQSMSASF
jgi:hypothetical protein